jgi:hypothetical protein
VASQPGDPNYLAATPVTNTLVIGKGVASVNLGGLTQTFNGRGRMATVTTVPAGLSVAVTYNGKVNEPIGAGSYTVVATANSANYAGSGTGTLVVRKAQASVKLGGLFQTYSGTPLRVNVMTTPGGLPTRVTYNGTTNLPVNIGIYRVTATITGNNHEGSWSDLMEVSKASEVVNLNKLGKTRLLSVKTSFVGAVRRWVGILGWKL